MRRAKRSIETKNPDFKKPGSKCVDECLPDLLSGRGLDQSNIQSLRQSSEKSGFLTYNFQFDLEGVKQKTLTQRSGFFGSGAEWARTTDSRIFSPMLYQLSYSTV